MTDNNQDTPNLIQEKEGKKAASKKTWKKILFFSFLGFVALAFGLYRFLLTGYSEAAGKVYSEKEQDIGTLMEGVLKEIHVKNAGKVKAGEVLFEFSNRELENAFLEVTKKKEALEETLKFSEKEILHTRSAYERAQILFENGVIGKGEFEGAELHQEKIEKEHFEIQDKINALKLQMEQLEREKEFLTVKAPFDGIFLGDHERLKNTFVKKGELLGKIFDASGFYFLAYFDEKDVSRIRIRDFCEIELDAFSGIFKGSVANIDETAYEITEKVYKIKNIIKVKITLDSFPDGLRPQMKGWVRVIKVFKNRFTVKEIENILPNFGVNQNSKGKEAGE